MHACLLRFIFLSLFLPTTLIDLFELYRHIIKYLIITLTLFISYIFCSNFTLFHLEVSRFTLFRPDLRYLCLSQVFVSLSTPCSRRRTIGQLCIKVSYFMFLFVYCIKDTNWTQNKHNMPSRC